MRLKDYMPLMRELTAVDKRLSDLQIAIGVQSAASFPYALHTVTITGYPPECRQLLDRRAELKYKIGEIVDFICKTPQPEQEMMRLHYMGGISWEGVGEIMHKSSEACRKQVGRYLVNLHKNGS